MSSRSHRRRPAVLRPADSFTLLLFHSFTRFVFAAAALLLTAAPASAQGTTIVQPQRAPYLELLVTGVLAGLVVFVVCRSSRRN